MNEFGKYIVQNAPVLIVLITWVILVERRLTRIETAIDFMAKNCKQCQPSSETDIQ